MPFYEYRCDNCGHEMEALQKLKDPPLVDCPSCGAPQLRKLISPTRFRLKGSGWYETDFKKSGKKNLHDAGRGASGKEAGDKEGGTKEPGGAEAAKSSSTKGAAPSPAAGVSVSKEAKPKGGGE